jgi:hypothetical protein
MQKWKYVNDRYAEIGPIRRREPDHNQALFHLDWTHELIELLTEFQTYLDLGGSIPPDNEQEHGKESKSKMMAGLRTIPRTSFFYRSS